ncbi:MAG: hypothetical protein ABFC67_10475 [Mizugakiibacter sp.]|uniref:hypothetical protein n=1 Tax=Mizugakiibacter sp. TaxID=1972610 RepID=UPI0031C8CF97|nr:hypothetical protein [Xanthomonadaceae bacterium]
MAKMSSGALDHAGFLAIKDTLTAELAWAIQVQLEEVGDDVKGISWFSSTAEEYALSKQLLAA